MEEQALQASLDDKFTNSNIDDDTLLICPAAF